MPKLWPFYLLGYAALCYGAFHSFSETKPKEFTMLWVYAGVLSLATARALRDLSLRTAVGADKEACR